MNGFGYQKVLIWSNLNLSFIVFKVRLAQCTVIMHSGWISGQVFLKSKMKRWKWRKSRWQNTFWNGKRRKKKKDAAQLLVQKAETSEQSNLHTSHCGPITIFVQKIQKMGFEEKKGFLEPKLNFSSKKWNFGFLDKKSWLCYSVHSVT